MSFVDAAGSDTFLLYFSSYLFLTKGTAIAQSVRQLATASLVWESNPGGGEISPHPSEPALGPTQPPIQWVPGLFPGVKRPERSVDYPHHSSAEVKERVELHLYSISGFSWPVLGRDLAVYNEL